jgi:hypothetical protein
VSRQPEPRPALRRAQDGALHPAAPRATPSKHLHPAPPAPAVEPPTPISRGPFKPGDLRARKAGSSGKGKKADELVSLKVHVPKPLRKAAKKQAKAQKIDLDAVVTDALAAWLQG